MSEHGGGYSRRMDDHCPTFKEMTDYVAREITEFHTIRSEGFLLINREMERMEVRIMEAIENLRRETAGARKSLDNRIERTQTDMDDHEKWHKENLQELINHGSQNRIAVGAIIIGAVCSIIATTAAVVIALTH